jgi:regulator of protease activity HflC (stomatin/prohibitin superfamily)
MPAIGILVAAALVVFWFLAGIRVVNEYEQGVVLRLGRFAGIRTAGLKWIIPVVDRMRVIDMRVSAEQVPPQDVITRDNVSVKVNAVIYFRVLQADRAFLQVTDFLFATSQFAQTTLRSVLGQVELDDLLSQRDKINRQLQEIIDRHTEPWGVKVTAVEVKQVDLPEEMRRAMAKQAEAERERRAKVIAAEGELQAADKLSQAATIIATAPGALQLRYLQTLVEISAEKNSTIIFPLPIDLVKPFLEAAARAAAGPTP